MMFFLKIKTGFLTVVLTLFHEIYTGSLNGEALG